MKKYENEIKIILIPICMFVTIFCLMYTGYIIGIEKYSKYDVNRDGKVNAVDYVIEKNYIISKGLNYDVNGDGSINSKDLLELKKRLENGE